MHKTKMMRMRNNCRRFSQMTAQVSQGLQPNGQQQQMKIFNTLSTFMRTLSLSGKPLSHGHQPCGFARMP